jgi:hypothetical protein
MSKRDKRKSIIDEENAPRYLHALYNLLLVAINGQYLGSWISDVEVEGTRHKAKSFKR